MNIIFKSENEEIFQKKWNEYINKNDVSLRYLLDHIEFKLLNCNNIEKDYSFLVVNNNECVGICFLPIENYRNIKSISLNDNYIISPLSNNKKVEKLIFDTIDSISKEENVKLIKFFWDTLLPKKQINPFLKYDFIDTSTSDCVVNLTVEEKDLWTKLRKHYKSMINGILKNEEFKIIVFDYKNINKENFENYKQLYFKCIEGKGRNLLTFDKQYELIKNKKALIIGLKYKDRYIGILYFFYFKNGAIYASGVNNPEYEQDINIYHSLLWKAQIVFKKLGVKILTYSQPCAYSKIQGFDDYYDEKQLNISHFKRGMGAEMMTFFRGIKYYDKSLFLDDIVKFKEKIKNS